MLHVVNLERCFCIFVILKFWRCPWDKMQWGMFRVTPCLFVSHYKQSWFSIDHRSSQLGTWGTVVVLEASPLLFKCQQCQLQSGYSCGIVHWIRKLGRGFSHALGVPAFHGGRCRGIATAFVLQRHHLLNINDNANLFQNRISKVN